jgi:PAS domain S-box-containing protein
MQQSYIDLIKQLDRFASAFSVITTLEELVLSVEKILEETFNVEYTGLYLFDPLEKRLKLMYAKGFDYNEFQDADQSAMQRHPGAVFRSGKMIYIPDTLNDAQQLTQSSKQNFTVRSRLYLPVMNGGQIIGAFGIVDSKPNAYDEENIATLSFICNLSGAMYGNLLNQNELKKMALIATETKNSAIITNKSGEIEWVNQAFTNITEYQLDEIKGKKPGDFLQGEQTDSKTIALLSEAISAEKSIEVDIVNYSKSHRKYWLKLQIQPVFDSVGRLENFISIQREITKEKENEQQLVKSEARHLRMVANISDVIAIFDQEGYNRYKSPNIEKLFGWKPEEVIGVSAFYNIHPDDIEISEQFFAKQVAEPGVSGKLEFRYRCKDESYKWVELTGINLLNDPYIQGILANYHDITERKIAEQNLNKLSRAVEQSPVMTYITDLNGAIEYVNPKVLEISGYSKEELIGRNPKFFNTGENQEENYTNLWQTISSGKEWKGEFHNQKKNKELYWVSASLSPVFNNTGNITHYIAVEENITQRKENFEALQITKLRFESLISSMQAGVMVEDENRKVLLVNQYFCNLFSIPVAPKQLIGMDCALAAEETKKLFDQPDIFINDIASTLNFRKAIVNHELQMRNGTSLERDFIPIGDSEHENQGILWIYRNISERKKAERDLFRQSEILGGTAKAMNYLLTITDHHQAMQKALEAVGVATGVDRAYIFEAKIDESTGETFLDQQFEWTGEGVIPEIGNSELQNMPFSREYPRWFNMLSNGETLSGLVKDFPANERQFLEPQNIISLIVVPVFVNDVFWGTVGFDDCSKGIQWSANEASILTALAASIGGSISREIIGQELSNARLIAETATKTKSNFLATMSHEIRTPMNGVIGMTSLLMQTQLTPDQLDYAETIKTSGELLLNLINDILDFSKIESGKMVLEEHQFDVRMAIEDVIDLVATQTSQKKLGLYFQVDPSIPQFIMGDLTRIRQILVNLVSNAVKFTPSGEIVIRVKQIEIQGDEATLEFSVKDTGVGIPSEKIDRLFKPFSQVDASTTRKYGGTGLGLAICYKLVKLMNGYIQVKSEPNKGSEFLFTIVTHFIKPEEKKQDELSTKLEILKGKKLLILDCHPTGSAILTSLFENLGMMVVNTTSFSETINRFRYTRDINLIIIDNEVSDVDFDLLKDETKNGIGLANIPVVLLTHNAFTGIGSYGNKSVHVRLNKPIKQSQILLYVSKYLASNEAIQEKSFIEPKSVLKINELYPLNILVAEDNTINQKLILKLFEMLGYNIHIAANGYEVLEALNRTKIDIIFMDIQMPEMDGLEATRQIISLCGHNKPLIVAMTANALKNDREICLAVGMDDYISKPLTINQVKIGLEKWVHLIRTTEK